MAPKEIYLERNVYNCLESPHELPWKNGENIKYIRSDLAVDREKLVEWANNVLSRAEMLTSITTNEMDIVRTVTTNVIKNLLEKMKEL